MLHRYINQFLEYCQLADFSVRSIQALTARLNEFEACLKSQRIRSVRKVTYRHLVDFVAPTTKPPQYTSESPVCGRSDNFTTFWHSIGMCRKISPSSSHILKSKRQCHSFSQSMNTIALSVTSVERHRIFGD